MPVVLVAVVVTAAAGLLARELYGPDQADTTPAASAVAPTGVSLPPSAQPGPPDVRGTADAVAHPLYEPVRQLLQTHFDAINGRNYARWVTTVTEARARTMPEKEWRKQYGTTKDGSVVVHRIETTAGDTAVVLLTFVSTQDPAQAPPELPVACIRWNVVYPLTRADDRTWLLDLTRTAATPQHVAC
ncbi:hypothetical protein BJP25_06995 [Actinokineospora bangkokensis]|uniref:Uncharacterized protein n=1 Tax=Actinokineospora bangkokensis TaxID=1193682 RepID=A0A1Q9LU05_9PSEU|nr:hypothetical protein BJP25_06995 [Actinokineospora bangkokensis]